MNVSLDGVANDGEPGEGDNNAADVEQIIGGRGNDTLRGNDLANTLRGDGGNNSLIGGLGDDLLVGGTDNDTAVAAVAVDGADRFVGFIGHG